MRPRFWAVFIFWVAVLVAATPASGGEAYVATASITGDAVYMAPGDNGLFSGPEDLQIIADSVIEGYGASRANGIGDFDRDGDMDYILAIGSFTSQVVFVITKSGPGNQFGFPVRVANYYEGFGPIGMTVADFNGDKMLDFVVTNYYSPNCLLFLNKNAGQPDVFEFEPVLLQDAGSLMSYGIDAADINNDGMTDFIVASLTDRTPFKVNLWSSNDASDVPIPKFDTRELSLSPPYPVQNSGYGIAVADFITIDDEDGNADLAVSNMNSLDIYRGDGLGSFTFFESIPLALNNNSPLDNGDFDGDGKQDLIAGNFGNDSKSVVVLFGDGTGDFRYSENDIYTRSDLMARQTVTGPPFESNIAPVAQLTPEIIEVTVGDTVEWDASGSYDEDGTIVSYEWDYGDGVLTPMRVDTMAAAAGSGEPQSSYVYYDSGTYTVTLNVTDDKGATTMVQAEVRVKPIEATVRFSPRKLNLKSRGKWVTATIWVPSEHNAGMINPDSLFLVLPEAKGSIQAHVSKRDRRYYKYYSEYSKYSGKRHHRKRKLKVKFDRQALIDALGDTTGPIALTVSGQVSSLEFSGTGTIIAFEKQKKSAFQKHLWKQIMSWFCKGKSKHK